MVEGHHLVWVQLHRGFFSELKPVEESLVELRRLTMLLALEEDAPADGRLVRLIHIETPLVRSGWSDLVTVQEAMACSLRRLITSPQVLTVEHVQWLGSQMLEA